MEKRRFSWISMLLALAIPAVFMLSCGKDDDDDESSNGSNSNTESEADDVKSVTLSWSLTMDESLYDMFYVVLIHNDVNGEVLEDTVDTDMSIDYIFAYSDAPQKAVGEVVLRHRNDVEVVADSTYKGAGDLVFSVIGHKEDGSVNKYLNHVVKLENSIKVVGSKLEKMDDNYSFVSASYAIK